MKTDLRGWWALRSYCCATVFASCATRSQELLWSERPSYFLPKSCLSLCNWPSSLLVVTTFSSIVQKAYIYSYSAALRDKMGQLLGNMVGGRLVVAADFLASMYSGNSNWNSILHLTNLRLKSTWQPAYYLGKYVCFLFKTRIWRNKCPTSNNYWGTPVVNVVLGKRTKKADTNHLHFPKIKWLLKKRATV